MQTNVVSRSTTARSNAKRRLPNKSGLKTRIRDGHQWTNMMFVTLRNSQIKITKSLRNLRSKLSRMKTMTEEIHDFLISYNQVMK